MTLTAVRSEASVGALLTAPLAVSIDRAVARRSVVTLSGEADASTTALLSEALSRVVFSFDGDVVVDVARLEFMDACTVRILATAQFVLANQGRRLSLRSPTRQATRVLGLLDQSELIETREETR